MLTGIHFLLTYACNSECDHCFLYCGPQSKGTFTLNQLKEVLAELVKIRTIVWVYFEGGEPFLFYPLMLEGIKITSGIGYKTGIVTNAYWATSAEDAELWLKSLREFKVSDLSISDDLFHFEEEEDNLAKKALVAAKKLGIPINSICIDKPAIGKGINKEQDKGEPVIGGGAMFRGRAVEKLTQGLPKKSWEEFKECPYEDLKQPERVHLDSYGNVFLCQGLSMGNMWEIPLSSLISSYDYKVHPICEPLVRGGPFALAKEYGFEPDDGYVDPCHLCYSVRLALLDRFPQYLSPRQVYGIM
jgi:MoaA/NifB/PqqE/SkfB family radical SAM enzyme